MRWKKIPGMKAYQCRVCHMYHIGHPNKEPETTDDVQGV